jgi:hypothetical protein
MSLPEGLDETYERILSNIPQSHRRYAIMILQFLTFSERPLRLDEMVDAIAVFPDRTPAFKHENRMPRPREITRYCASLVRITGGKPEGLKGDIQELQLAHFSVKEFLVSNRISQSFKDAFEEIQARSTIVTVSLSYLFVAAQDEDVSKRRKKYPFSDYCARYWVEHAAVAKEDENLARERINKFFARRAAYTYWLSIHDPDEPYGRRTSKQKPVALYYASLKGLTKSVKQLLDRGADVNARCGGSGNAHQATSPQGDEKLVQMMLQRVADINARGGKLGTALQAASRGSHIEVVRMLLHAGANVNAKGGLYGNALQAASGGGHEKVV